MSNPFYTKMQKVATKLLRKFGNPGYLKYVGPKEGGVEDEDLGGTIGGNIPDPVDVVGVVTELDRKYINGVTIKETDQMLVADNSVQLSRDGSIQVGDRVWKIISVLPSNPAGQQIVQKVVIRG